MQERVEAAASDAIKAKAKELFPTRPEDQLPVEGIQIDDLPTQASVLSQALPNKNKHHVMGLGESGAGVLRRIRGTSRTSTRSSSLLRELQEAKEDGLKAQEEATALRVQNQQLLANQTVLEHKMGNVEAQLAILMVSHNSAQAPV